MSLLEAMKFIVERMEDDADNMGKDSAAASIIRSYSMQIQVAMRASVGTNSLSQISRVAWGHELVDSESKSTVPSLVAHAIERQQGKLKNAAHRADMEEKLSREIGEVLVEFVGGSMDNSFGPMQGGSPPVGAKSMVNGQLYVFKEDRKFHYVESK